MFVVATAPGVEFPRRVGGCYSPLLPVETDVQVQPLVHVLVH